MNNWFQIDERTEGINEKLSFLFLGLTQLALYLAIVYQRYIEGLPIRYYNDAAIILILTVVGYWGARFYFGGIYPNLSFKRVLLIYVISVAAIGVPHTIVHSWPQSGEWLSRALSIFGGPAVLVVCLAFLAYLGKKRTERLISKQ